MQRGGLVSDEKQSRRRTIRRGVEGDEGGGDVSILMAFITCESTHKHQNRIACTVRVTSEACIMLSMMKIALSQSCATFVATGAVAATIFFPAVVVRALR